MKVGLFFGSFNPIHNGHLAIAEYLHNNKLFDQIWMVVSPNNPLKNKNDLLDENDRLNMVNLAIQDFPYLHACDAEFFMTKPSYTINTLLYLESRHPNYVFSLILGEDNLDNFHLWKNYEEILKRYVIYVYPRSSEELFITKGHPHIIYFDAPLLPVSATIIRSLLQQKKQVTKYLPTSVLQYINNKQLFNNH
jgi:nicotinate-nucleotide adenylyltransferase